MTSLSQQLEALRVAASGQLGVERSHVSLLFSKKEAAALYKDDVLKIGQSGIAQLRKIDSSIAKDEDSEELFGETALSIQRALLSKAENEKLDRTLERILVQISPYLLHFAAQQVLEWLIFQFQIHSFNGPKVFITFLPFHYTKVFGRLLSILDLKGIEYDWVREYGKIEAPISFERLVTTCFSANHSLLSMVCKNIEDIVELIGGDYAERNLSLFFTFYVKLGIHLVSDSTKVNDMLISKILPFLATSLRSHLTSLRLGSLMIASQLCISAVLNKSILHSLLKVILLKINATTMEASLNAVMLICERQDVKVLPVKGLKKLVRKNEDLKIDSYINFMSKKTDLSKFLLAVWCTLLPILYGNDFNEDDGMSDKLCNFMINCSAGEILDGEMATSLFAIVFDNFANADNDNTFPEIFCKHLRSLVLRFGLEFDTVCAEWKLRDQNTVDGFLKMCSIEDHEIGSLVINNHPEKKRRRRNSSHRRSLHNSEDVEKLQERRIPHLLLRKEQEEKQLESLREPEKPVFRGNPLEKIPDLVDNARWDDIILGLEKLTTEKFIRKYEAKDFEQLIVILIKCATISVMQLKAEIRSALSRLPMRSDFACVLLQKSSHEPAEKRTRGAVKRVNHFVDESDEEYKGRLIFVLEVLNANSSVVTSSKLFSTVFSLFKLLLNYQESEEEARNYFEHLLISLLVRMIKNPVNYVVQKDDLQLDCIVETVRNTLNQYTLRGCLRLLTAAIKISPSGVLSQIMSVFTFMGSGLLKKDNDLTLGIIEETLTVLLSAVVVDNDRMLNDGLVSVARIFAASVVDIPAHRRVRVLHAVAKASTAKHLWAVIAVLFEQYCITWQRSNFNKGRANVEQFEEMATEMISLYSGAEQLLCAINLVEYIVFMGGDEVEVDGKKRKSLFSTTYVKLFDRSKHSVQKLRHYRFAIIGWIARLLSSKDLFDKLCDIDDEEMYEQLVVIGRRMLICSMELDEFVTARGDKKQNMENPSEPATVKYWAAVTSRADIVAEKFRNLLPASVSGRLIADILADNEAGSKMRDRALQLLNVKLMQDSVFRTDGGISPEHLTQFAEKLFMWIKPAEAKEEVILCQNAAFSLRLIARRLPSAEGGNALKHCIKLCEPILKNWRSLDEVLVGNVFLLTGEIFKSHNTGATLLASDFVVPTCIDVVNQQLENTSTSKCTENLDNSAPLVTENRDAKRRRVAQQSMSGRRLGGDSLLVCALTCLQRILDQFAHYVSAHFEPVLLTLSRLSARYDPRFEIIEAGDKSPIIKSFPIQSRISMIRKALAKVELRVILQPFESSCQKLLKEPKAMVYLFSLYSLCLETNDRILIVKVLATFCNFVLIAFRLRSMNPFPEAYEITTDCESRMITSFLRVVECLSENDLRPIMSKLYKWIDTTLKVDENNNNRSYIVSVFNILNGFYDAYNALALPHFGRIFEQVPKVLRRMQGKNAEAVDSLLFYGKKGTFEALEGNALLILVIDFVAKCAKHPEFFSDERAQLVLEPLIDELDNSVIWGHEQRCLPHLADCLYNVADTHGDIMSEMFNMIMLKTRNPSAKIRYRTLLLLERMFSRMGEAVAPLLPSVLPFLSELLEDENKKVEDQCDKVLNVIRQNFGEEIADNYV